MDYTQQILVKEIGILGQQKIQEAKVLIIGAGGLGIPLATYLTTMGVGKLGIVDGDTVAISNLHRQFMFTKEEIDMNKSKVLSKKLIALNEDIEISSFNYFIDESNINEICRDYDIICDCSDNASTRLLIDNHCYLLSKPLVYGVCRDWQGYVTILNYKNKIRLTDLFTVDQMIEEQNNNCSYFGIVSSVCGIIASYQATELIKLITGQELILDGSILCINTLNNTSRLFRINKEN